MLTRRQAIQTAATAGGLALFGKTPAQDCMPRNVISGGHLVSENSFATKIAQFSWLSNKQYSGKTLRSIQNQVAAMFSRQFEDFKEPPDWWCRPSSEDVTTVYKRLGVPMRESVAFHAAHQNFLYVWCVIYGRKKLGCFSGLDGRPTTKIDVALS